MSALATVLVSNFAKDVVAILVNNIHDKYYQMSFSGLANEENPYIFVIGEAEDDIVDLKGSKIVNGTLDQLLRLLAGHPALTLYITYNIGKQYRVRDVSQYMAGFEYWDQPFETGFDLWRGRVDKELKARFGSQFDRIRTKLDVSDVHVELFVSFK